ALVELAEVDRPRLRHVVAEEDVEVTRPDVVLGEDVAAAAGLDAVGHQEGQIGRGPAERVRPRVVRGAPELAEELGRAVEAEEPGAAAGEDGERLRPVAFPHAEQLLRDAVERLVPAHALEPALPALAHPALRIEHAMLAVVHLHEELALRTEMAAGDGVVRVARDGHDAVAAPIDPRAAAVEADIAPRADHLGAEDPLAGRRVREGLHGLDARHGPPRRLEDALAGSPARSCHAPHRLGLFAPPALIR